MTSAGTRPILVTRPEESGRELTAALIARGANALWVPAFDLAPPPDPAAARAALARLATFDLAMFVSPAAVRATAPMVAGAWPSATVIGAAGRATVEAVHAALRLDAGARVVAPAGDDEGGSEALLRALDAAGIEARCVLILRAGSGREWLRDRLAERGALVEVLAVYDRRAHVLSSQEREQLARMGTQPIDSVFSSSEAVDALRSMLAPATWDALLRGTAVASHSRIAQRLADAGFARVRLASLHADPILAALRDSAARQ